MSSRKQAGRHPSEEVFIRFESPEGLGLFARADWLRDQIALRSIKVRRDDAREIEAIYFWLREHTPAPPHTAYRDDRSRLPRTWFKPSARQHIEKSLRLCRLANKYGANVRVIRSRRPGGRILFEDEVQIVVRPHRAAQALDDPPARQSRTNRDRTTIRKWNLPCRRQRIRRMIRPR